MNDEFKKIPDYPDYEISRSGAIRHISTGKIKYARLTRSGYYRVSLKDIDGITRNTGLHRLLGLTYLDLPNNYKSLVINHIDGNPGNNHIENLEWCTARDNVIHAGYMGLTTKCKPIEVRNIQTGETWVFDCYADAGKHFGLTKDAISWRVNSGENRVDNLFNQYRTHKRIGEPWRNPEIWDCGVLLRNAISKEVTKFPTQFSVCEYLSLSPAYISRFINDKKQGIFRAKDSLYQIIPFSLNPEWVEMNARIKNMKNEVVDVAW